MVLKGAVFPNNGLVTRDDIGNDGGGGGSVEDTLQCLTDDFACCMTASDSFWFFPSGNEVVGRSVDPIVDFYRTRGVVGTGGIYLHRRSDAGGVDDDGIYRCHIPGLEGSRTVYIGIYGSNTGTIIIMCTPLHFPYFGFQASPTLINFGVVGYTYFHIICFSQWNNPLI